MTICKTSFQNSMQIIIDATKKVYKEEVNKIENKEPYEIIDLKKKILASIFGRLINEEKLNKLKEKNCCELLNVEYTQINEEISKKIEDINNIHFDNIEHITPIILQNVYEGLLSIEVNQKKGNGIYYTPQNLGNEMSKELIKKHFEQKYGVDTQVIENIITDINNKNELSDEVKEKLDVIYQTKILDLCCGSGAFTIPLLRNCIKIAKYLRENTDTDLLDMIKENFTAVDKDPIAVEITKLRILLMLINEFEFEIDIIEKEIFGNIKCEDVLGYIRFKSVHIPRFDIIISNPPYYSYSGKKIPDEIKNLAEVYQNRYNVKEKRGYDLYYLIYHIALDLLKENGSMNILTTNTYFYNDSSTDLRKRLSEEVIINSIDILSKGAAFGAEINPTKVLLYKNIECIDKINKDVIVKVFTSKKKCFKYQLNNVLLFDKENNFRIVYYEDRMKTIIKKMDCDCVKLGEICKFSERKKGVLKLEGKRIYSYKLEDNENNKIVFSEYLKVNAFALNTRYDVWDDKVLCLEIKRDGTYNININYLLGVLNSKLSMYWLLFKGKRKTGLEIYLNKNDIMSFPVKIIYNQEQIINIIEKVKIISKLNFIKDENDRVITKILKENIDEIIYEIYNVNEDHKKIINQEIENYFELCGNEIKSRNLFY